MLGRILICIGAILLVIAGVTYLIPGYTPLPWLNGLTYLLLGIGLLLFMRQVMRHESGRAARDKTESQRRAREDARWKNETGSD